MYAPVFKQVPPVIGVPTPPPPPIFDLGTGLQIDTDNDTILENTAAESFTARIPNESGFVAWRGLDEQVSTLPPKAGTFQTELLNFDKALNPRVNPVHRGQRVRYRTKQGVDVWRGFIDSLHHNPDPTERRLSLNALGTLSRLNIDVATPVYKNISVGAAIQALFNLCGLQGGGDYVVNDFGYTNLQYWWANGNAYQELFKLINTEGPSSLLFEDRYGRIVFHPRHYLRENISSRLWAWSRSEEHTSELQSRG